MNADQQRAWRALDLGPTLLVRRPGAAAVSDASPAVAGTTPPADQAAQIASPVPLEAVAVPVNLPVNESAVFAAPASPVAHAGAATQGQNAPAADDPPVDAAAAGAGQRRRGAPGQLLAAAAALQNKAADDELAAVASMDWPALSRTIASCQRCGLCRSRKQVVAGRGTTPARWVLIGAAPGASEEAAGEPVAGKAGRLLDAMLTAAGGGKQEVFVLNAVQCRPPDQRDPSAQELAACRPLVQRQLELLAPALVLTMGQISARTMLGNDETLEQLRGKVHQLSVAQRTVPLVATYHPEHLLRESADKLKSWQDLCLARSVASPQSDDNAA